MATAKLRKVGGSVMVALPPSVLAELGLAAGGAVELSADGGSVVMRPAKPRYTLDELLTDHKKASRRLAQDKEWLSDQVVGRELI